MEPDVVCAVAFTANSKRTKTSIGLKYLIPSPFLAVCVAERRNFVGLNLQIRGKVCQGKLAHLTGKVTLLYRYSESSAIQSNVCRTTKFRITSSRSARPPTFATTRCRRAIQGKPCK